MSHIKLSSCLLNSVLTNVCVNSFTIVQIKNTKKAQQRQESVVAPKMHNQQDPCRETKLQTSYVWKYKIMPCCAQMIFSKCD